ncbi:hypothetical protein SAY86_013402 [Trapa natans]|uniref:Uncharacterized protein n=1 Tax=Trapa natans TaxID=22666 RepID=A0AAN7RF93_TRANT|nr:hypothetical protein SAY86_013402 [Trapa natans]
MIDPRCKEGSPPNFPANTFTHIPLEHTSPGKKSVQFIDSASDRSSELNPLIRMAKIRRACRRMWQAVPCTSRRALRTESQKDIHEILKGKLETIVEEPESAEECCKAPPMRHVLAIKKGGEVKKVGQIFLPHISLKDSYCLFIAGFASKGSFGGLLQ